MTPKVGIVDYGIGNIKSITNALIAIGAEPVVSSDHNELAGCDKMILPGVGAFAHGMNALRELDLVSFLQDQSALGKPLLGICLGMQLLTACSTEHGTTEGLGIIEGNIDLLPAPRNKGFDFRLPNVGWQTIEQTHVVNDLAKQMLDTNKTDDRFYFIHSYMYSPEMTHTAAISNYLGVNFAAMIAHNCTVGTQFHPEKSGPQGLKMLKNFTL